MEKFQIQNCIDWNIRARDGAHRRAIHADHEGDAFAARDACREERRYQRNIDQLNRQL